VWIGLVISIAVVTFVLTLMQRYLAYQSLSKKNSTPKQSSANQTAANQIANCIAKEFTGTQYLYVLGNLLSQGENRYELCNNNEVGKIYYLIQIKGVRCESNRLSLRLVAGVWCLAAFVFVQAYMSTLITYVVTPINFPLINSAYDIPGTKEVNELIRKSGLVDYYFSASSFVSRFENETEF
jgi:ionotropic glutamate receptor